MEAALSVGLGVGSIRCTAGQLRRVVVVVGCAARVPWLHTRENVTRSHPGWGLVGLRNPTPRPTLLKPFGTKAHMVDGMAVAVQPLR